MLQNKIYFYWHSFWPKIFLPIGNNFGYFAEGNFFLSLLENGFYLLLGFAFFHFLQSRNLNYEQVFWRLEREEKTKNTRFKPWSIRVFKVVFNVANLLRKFVVTSKLAYLSFFSFHQMRAIMYGNLLLSRESSVLYPFYLWVETLRGMRSNWSYYGRFFNNLFRTTFRRRLLDMFLGLLITPNLISNACLNWFHRQINYFFDSTNLVIWHVFGYIFNGLYLKVSNKKILVNNSNQIGYFKWLFIIDKTASGLPHQDLLFLAPRILLDLFVACLRRNTVEEKSLLSFPERPSYLLYYTTSNYRYLGSLFRRNKDLSFASSVLDNFSRMFATNTWRENHRPDFLFNIYELSPALRSWSNNMESTYKEVRESRNTNSNVFMIQQVNLILDNLRKNGYEFQWPVNLNNFISRSLDGLILSILTLSLNLYRTNLFSLICLYEDNPFKRAMYQLYGLFSSRSLMDYKFIWSIFDWIWVSAFALEYLILFYLNYA